MVNIHTTYRVYTDIYRQYLYSAVDIYRIWKYIEREREREHLRTVHTLHYYYYYYYCYYC